MRSFLNVGHVMAIPSCSLRQRPARAAYAGRGVLRTARSSASCGNGKRSSLAEVSVPSSPFRYISIARSAFAYTSSRTAWVCRCSRLIIGNFGPSDSALAASSGWRLLAAQPLTATLRATLLGTCARAAPLGAIRPRWEEQASKPVDDPSLILDGALNLSYLSDCTTRYVHSGQRNGSYTPSDAKQRDIYSLFH